METLFAALCSCQLSLYLEAQLQNTRDYQLGTFMNVEPKKRESVETRPKLSHLEASKEF